MEKQEIKDLIAGADIVAIIGKYVNLKRQGAEHIGLCPFHSDKHSSLKVNGNKKVFKCFACDAAGDVVAFLMKWGKSFPESLAELKGESSNTVTTPESRESRQKTRKTWTPIKPVGKAPAAKTIHYVHGEPSALWQYNAADGSPLGYVCRFDTPNGKEVIPLMYCQCEEKTEWRWQGFPHPRPIYGLDRLANNATATVIVVEGEKCADAGQKLLPTAVVVSWPGGSKAIDTIDWGPLHGRNVMLWPDNHTEDTYGEKHQKAGQLKPWGEQDGNAAMLRVAGHLKGKCPKILWIEPPADAVHKWDIADAVDWTPETAKEYVLNNHAPVPEVVAEEPVVEPPAPAQPAKITPPPKQPEPPKKQTDQQHGFFRFLGYDKNEACQQSFYFFVYASKKVIRFSATSLASTANLITLAPLSHWEMEFPGKTGININAAVNALVQMSNAAGIFKEKFIRGRGAWMDAGRVVVHAGDRLIVDGSTVPLQDLKTRYIYEAQEALELGTAPPLTATDAAKFLAMLKLLNWEREINPYLLAGWCIMAPVCGALVWRPHIWITGPAGCGKSWLFKNIVRKSLGNCGLAVQGETSEAGLRQTLGYDAIPVVFDEAEGEDRKASERMQHILTLVRSASADDGGNLLKGSPQGTAKAFVIKSCFAFASIGLTVSKESDWGRITVLSLKKGVGPDAAARWRRLQEMYASTMTPEYSMAMQSRTIQLLPIILRNAETFSAAAASVLGEQRAGDQIGALLAGAYSLHSNAAITYDKAVEWVQAREWSEERASERMRDEWALLAFIVDMMTMVDNEMMAKVERSVGELIQLSAGLSLDEKISGSQAQARLKRLGIKVGDQSDDNWLYISNSSEWIQRVLQNSPWSRNHNKILMRIDGAENIPSTKFASGIQTRAVRIPLNAIFKKD